MVRRLARFAAVAAAVALPAVAQAQLSCNVVGAGNCAVNATASLTIPSLASITIPANAITLDGSGITSFAALQYVPGAFGNVDVSANTTYSITIGSAAAAWTGPGVRARNTLEYSIDGGGTWAALAASSALPGAAATDLLSTPMQFRAVIPAGASNPANTPGVYTLLVDFTLTAP
jgi:hypothetical protein